MGLFRKRREQPQCLRVETFTTAARAAGFELDGAQVAAAQALAGHHSIYLVGPAGRGKTWLLDAYFGTLPTGSATRMHWHEFVRDLHRLIRDNGGLDGAVESLLDVDVLGFDELGVDDPADGIFVHRLVAAAIERGVRLVVTSNSRPDELMPNPHFHDTFLPTIELIANHCRIVELDIGVDYRRGVHHDVGFASGRWATTTTPAELSAGFPLMVNGRTLEAQSVESNHLRVTFAEICGRALGATDYLAMTRQFTSWTVLDVPDLASAGREPALRFAHLIDVLYDNDTPLTIESPFTRAEFSRLCPPMPIAARMLSRLSTLRDSPSNPDQ